MVQQVTKGIKISVETHFEGALYSNHKIQFAFKYQITIENQSKDLIQLTSRHWNIKDSLNNNYIVSGEGVVGKKPVIKPGYSHTYSSGCMLLSGYGAMNGYFKVINLATSKPFRVIVPSFKLCAPFALN